MKPQSGTKVVNDTSEERDYWLDKLSQRPSISSLPARRSGAAGADLRSGSVEIVLAGELHQKLEKLTAGKPFLLYAALMATLKVCIYKYTGNNRIVVGSPARRNDSNNTGEANALAIIDEVDGRLTFKQLLLNVRQTLLDAYTRQHYPFSRLLMDLGLSPVEKRGALFDIALVLKELHTDLPEVGNSINIIFNKEPERITGVVSYHGTIHDPVIVERFGHHFVNILRGALDNSERAISAIPMLDEAEIQELRIQGQGENKSSENYSCIHRLFEAQVARTPEATALIFEKETLTYAELNERANKLVRHLQSLGVGSETRVAIFMERSVNLIVSIFAIMKAGGAYVLLDPTYPHQRLKYMLEDSRAILVLTESEGPQFVSESDVPVVSVNGEWAEIGQESVAAIASSVSGENLAYVIYTSGSTGQPKGVLVTHAALVNFTQCAVHHFGLDASDRLLQFLSPSFDAFGEELYPTLCSGATLLMHRHPTELSPRELLDFCELHAITALHFVTVYTTLLADELSPGGRRLPERVKLLISGGESLTGETVRRLREAGGESVRILHVYGPTETTITATQWEVGEVGGTGRVAIGQPLWNVQVYVVDGEEELVAVGVTGELYIGGAGVARGYEGDARQTAERFVPDRWSGIAGGRLYRTGDLVRYGAGGLLEFVGRGDEQVKLHGHRIELEEIEAALGEMEGVRDAVVLLREDVPNEKRLVAYVVPAGESAIDAGELRKKLKKRLPLYMMPVFVVLDSLPKTDHGKVDYQALPAPEDLTQFMAHTYVAPRTPLEEMLAKIWADVLGIERVGVNDDFFQLGGHSMLATQIISQVREALQTEVPFNTIFDSPTVGGMALTIGQRREAKSDEDIEQMLTELESLSEDDVKLLLEMESTQREKS